MPARLAVICIVGALVLSAGFLASGVLTSAWVTDVPKTSLHEVIRAFYMPQALSAVVVLHALEIGHGRDANVVMTYVLWFAASLPASLIYMVLAVACIKLIRRRRDSSSEPA